MRMIDADALLDSFAAENDAKECQWTLYGVKRKIEDAPTQEPKWIPVSERLPEEFADVFCSTDAEEVFIATYLGKMNDGVDCFDDDNGMMWEGDVIAWMSLPEPYKAESEE